MIKNISVIGDGGWGTTLAVYLNRQGYRVSLWGAFKKYVDFLRKTRENKKFLPGIRIPKSIILHSQIKAAVHGADLIVLAVPSQYAESVLKKLKKTDCSKKIILSVVKGIDTKTLKRISETVHKHLGDVTFAVLSGPTIAKEVVCGIPSAAVIASRNTHIAKKLQRVFHSKTFRIYTNKDVAGVELGGSMKNIIAIACGVCDGLGLGANTKAAIITRGLTEMTRLGQAMGGRTKTFAGLAGLGDIVTTCMSPQSRNRNVGEKLGKGLTIKKILGSTEAVAEGVPTVKAICRLSKKYQVSTPICDQVYQVIYHRKKPIQAVVDLMTRQLKAE